MGFFSFEQQLVDIFTKPLSIGNFKWLKNILGVDDQE